MNEQVWTAFIVGICCGVALGMFLLLGLYWLSTRGQRLPASFQPREPLPTAREMRQRKKMRAELRANIVRRA